MTQHDFNHFRGPDGTVQPHQAIVGGIDEPPDPRTRGGFVGGFTPHYPSPANTFQSPYPPPQPHSLPNPYDGTPRPPVMNNSQLPPLPPRPPNFPYRQPPNYYAKQQHQHQQQQHVDTDPNVSPFTSNSHLQSISSMSATERSRNLRIAKTKPHLQFMVGPLLRYDTIENGVWRGAALIVSECAYSRMHFFYVPCALTCVLC